MLNIKIAILMAYTKNIYGWCEYPVENNKAYAKKNKYTFISEEISYSFDKNPQWYKIEMIKKYINFYDWVFWLDADAFILDFNKKLEDFLSGDFNFHVCEDIPDWIEPVDKTLHNFNTGTMFLKNDDLIKKILNNSLNFKELYHKFAFDQTALNRMYRMDLEFKKKTLIHDHRAFNGIPPFCGSFILHLTGKEENRNENKRLTIFQNLYKKMSVYSKTEVPEEFKII